MIHLLCIGINEHHSLEVPELSSAVNDAKAFYSLIKDNYKDISFDKLLLNSDATKKNILESLQRIISDSTESDTVFIFYSGHGTDTFSLVASDFDPDNLGESEITMEQLVDYFSSILCKVGILFLDCCFSGGAGSKILNTGLQMKGSFNSKDNFLELLKSKGKAIFTASNPQQEAWELSKYGHGFFTHHLIKCITGENLTESIKTISINEIGQYLAKEVEIDAKRFGVNQVPTIKSNIEGNLELPILRKGSLYTSFFPNDNLFKTDGSISDLNKWNIPNEIIEIYSSKISSFNELQIDAINNYGVFDGDNIIVVAPTSSGKTLIGELSAVKNFFENKKSIFLLPMKSLVNDKYYDLKEKFDKYGIRIIRSTGDNTDKDKEFRNGKFDICLMTYEKFSIQLALNPHLLNQLGVIVIDELQMITDKTRGIGVEVMLTLIKTQIDLGVAPQLIALSAVVGDLNYLDEWLKAKTLRISKRPVVLEEGVLTHQGFRRFLDANGSIQNSNNYALPVYTGKDTGQIITIPLVKKLIDAGEKIIIFRSYVPQTIATARYLSSNLNLPSATNVISQLPVLDNSRASASLREYLKVGIAFHNRNLTPQEKEIIESDFRNKDGEIRIVVATTTLAMGINTPSDTVIIADLERYTDRGMEDYTIAEYKNMIGRAGRLGMSIKGKSFIITESIATLEQKWRKYVLGTPEDINSQFTSQDTAHIIVNIVSFLKLANKGSLKNVFISLFGNYQKVKTIPNIILNLENEFERTFLELVNTQIIIQQQDLYHLSELGRIIGEEGIRLESVMKISRQIQNYDTTPLSIEEIIYLTLTTEEILSMIFPLNKKGESKERFSWYNYCNSIPSLRRVMNLNSDVLTLKRFATLDLFIKGVPINDIENEIQKHNYDKDLYGNIRNLADRSKSFVKAITRISSALNSSISYDEDFVREIQQRLEFGIPANLISFIRDERFSFTRGELLALEKNGLNEIKTLKENIEKAESILSSQNIKVLKEYE